MKMLKFLFLCMSSLVLCSCATLPSNYLSLADNARLQIEDIVGQIKDRKVVFIGEGHMNGADHLVQLEIIRRLHESGKKVAVAMEMFTDKKNPSLRKWSNGNIGDAEFKREYAAEWTVPFHYYADIFLYAQDKRIPLFGLNADKTTINHIAKYGPGAIGSDMREKLKFTTCAEEPQYETAMKAYEDRTKTSHSAALPFLCDAQRARDATMAYNLANIIGSSEGVVIVLIGSAHASKVAMPNMLRNHLNVNYAVLIPRSFAGLTGKDVSAGMADYIWY